MRPRIQQELALLRQHYGEVEHDEVAGDDWFRVPRYPIPTGWCVGNEPADHVPVAFHVAPGHPGTVPYGFLAPASLNFNGAKPVNTGAPPKAPPFASDWIHFSWSVDNWAPTADVCKGSNLLSWVRGFAARFREGA
jgi:hypothetical protein